MANDFVRDQRIEMRIGDDGDLALRRLQDRRGRQFLRLLGEADRKLRETGIRQQLLAPSLGDGFEAALLPDGVVTLLMPVARLRNDVNIALRKRERLRDQRTLGTDEQLMPKLAGRRHRAEGDVVPEAFHFTRGLQRDALELLGIERAGILLVDCGDLIANRSARFEGSADERTGAAPNRFRKAAFSRALIRARW